MQVLPHEALTGNIVRDDPSEAGRRGAQVREERRLANLADHRDYVEKVYGPLAIEAFGDLLIDRDPRARRYRFAAAEKVLSGIGVLTEQKHIQVDIRAEVSALIAAFTPE